jgi:hypothetical protein
VALVLYRLPDKARFFECPAVFAYEAVDVGLFQFRAFFEVQEQAVPGFNRIVIEFRP